MKGTTMLRKSIIAIAIGMALFVLTACGGAAAVAESPNSINGAWAFEEGNTQFKADVQNGTILINVTFETSTGLYWKGTFPQDAGEDQTISSIGDQKAMAKSLYGSKSETKEFVYSKGDQTITFDFTMLGVTRQIVLTK